MTDLEKEGYGVQEDNFDNIPPEIKNLIQSTVLPLQAQIDALQRQLAQLENANTIKDAEIAHLKEVIETYKRMLFGSKSEKTRYLSQMDQMSLFHPSDVPENAVDKKKTVVIPEHTRQVKSKQDRDDYIKLMIDSGRFPVETVVYDVPEEERFDAEGNPLERLGVEHVRYELHVTSKQYSIQDIQVVSYGSKRSKDTDGTRTEVKEGEVPAAIIPHSPVGASVLTDVVVNKCDYALPLYRQERMMRDMGLPIRRNVMAGWFISAAELGADPGSLLRILFQSGRKDCQAFPGWIYRESYYGRLFFLQSHRTFGTRRLLGSREKILV